MSRHHPLFIRIPLRWWLSLNPYTHPRAGHRTSLLLRPSYAPSFLFEILGLCRWADSSYPRDQGTDTLQSLTPVELFEAGASGAWSNELYHLPPHKSSKICAEEEGSYQTKKSEGGKLKTVNPHSICSEASSTVSDDSEGSPRLSTRSKGRWKEGTYPCDAFAKTQSVPYHECLVCHVRNHHSCLCNAKDLSSLPRRLVAGTARENIHFHVKLPNK
jgi:hypothetical protein